MLFPTTLWPKCLCLFNGFKNPFAHFQSNRLWNTKSMNPQPFHHSTLTQPSNGSTDETFLCVYIFNHRTAPIKIVLLFFAPIFELKRLSVTFFLAECFFSASDFHCKWENTWLNYLVRSFLLLADGEIFLFDYFLLCALFRLEHCEIIIGYEVCMPNGFVVYSRMDYLKSKHAFAYMAVNVSAFLEWH